MLLLEYELWLDQDRLDGEIHKLSVDTIIRIHSFENKIYVLWGDTSDKKTTLYHLYDTFVSYSSSLSPINTMAVNSYKACIKNSLQLKMSKNTLNIIN